MKTSCTLAALSSAFLIAAALPRASARAASSPVGLPVQLAPVVVTGDLWATDLARTSASVTVFDATRLADSGVQSFGDLVAATANVTWTGGTSRARFFQVRGIGENSQFEGETPDAAVRFVIDDLDFTGLGGAATLFDVQQVEVLRGPQAGAFGANAAGGLIKVVTAEPTAVREGYVMATVGDDALRRGGFAVSGPLLADIPERLTFRLAAERTVADGFRDNAFLGRSKTNAIDELSVRLKLRLRTSNAWQWDATVFYADQDNGYDEFSLNNTGFTTFSDEPGRDTQESVAGSVRGVYTGEALVLTTRTSFTGTESEYSFDSDWTFAADPRGYDSFLATERSRDVFNQELRFDSAPGAAQRWTIGAYYETTVEDTFLTEDFGGATTRFDATTLALFGQVGFRLAPATRLIVGTRVENYDLATRIEFRDDVDFADTLLGGKVTLEHDLSERALVFATVTRGYKAGGANIYNFLVVPDEGPADYVTETLWNYELGWRGRNANGRVSGELTAFYLDRRDPQVRDSAGFGDAFTYFVDNGRRASIYGLEASGRIELTATFSAYANLGLMESDLESFAIDNTAATPAGGRELANVPAYTYTVGGRFGRVDGFFATTELSGRAAYFESNTHAEKRSTFTVANASVGYRREAWSVTVWARNVFDERYEKRIFYFGNAGPDFETRRYESPADPRQVGVSARWEF